MIQPMNQILYTADQVADQLGLNPRHVRRLAYQLGVGFKIGSRWLLRPRDIRRLERRPKARKPAQAS